MSQIAALRPLPPSIHHDRDTAARALAEAQRALEAGKHRAQFHQSLAYLAGRLLLSTLFFVSAVAKMVRFDQTVAALREAGMDDAGILLPFAIAVEVVGAAFLASGYKVRRIAVGLMVYLAGVTLLIAANLSESLNANSAIANVGFIGALLMIAAHGAGKYSLDEWLRRRAARRFNI